MDHIGETPDAIEPFVFKVIESLAHSDDITSFEIALTILTKGALLYHQVRECLCHDVFWETIRELLIRNPEIIGSLAAGIGLFIEVMEHPSFVVTVTNINCAILMATNILKTNLDHLTSHNVHNLIIFLFDVIEKAGENGFKNFNALLNFSKLLTRITRMNNSDIWIDCLDFICFCFLHMPEYADLLDFELLDELIEFLIAGVCHLGIESDEQINVFLLANEMIARGSSLPYRLFYTELGQHFIEAVISVIAYAKDHALSREAANIIINCLPKFPIDCSLVLQKAGAMFIFLDCLEETSLLPFWHESVFSMLEVIWLMCECGLTDESKECLLGEGSLALFERLELSGHKNIRDYSVMINKAIGLMLTDNLSTQ